jgi:hypothetical protein
MPEELTAEADAAVETKPKRKARPKKWSCQKSQLRPSLAAKESRASRRKRPPPSKTVAKKAATKRQV